MILYGIARFLAEAAMRFYYHLEVRGLNNLPKDGKFILCGNHITALDPVIIAAVIRRRHIHYMAKSNLFKNKLYTWFFSHLGCIRVNRDGNDIASLKASMKVLKDGHVLGIFPEGTRHDDQTKMGEPKPGMAMLAIKTRTPILPVNIQGGFGFRGKVIVTYGEPFELTEYYGKKKYSSEDYVEIGKHEVCSRIMELREAHV